MFRNLWQAALMFNDDGGDGGGGGTGGNGGNEPPAAGQNPPAPAFPPNTPVKDMTAEEQVAYWKHHARKWQGRAEGRDDYDDVKAELERLKRERLSDQEKAVEDAKKTARDEAVRDLGPAAIRTTLDIVLAAKGLKDDEIESQLEFVDLSKFLTDSGEVNTDKVKNYVAGVAPARGHQGWPDTGAGRRGDPDGKGGGGTVQSGRDAYVSRHNPKK